jgi:hypothetical protein
MKLQALMMKSIKHNTLRLKEILCVFDAHEKPLEFFKKM